MSTRLTYSELTGLELVRLSLGAEKPPKDKMRGTMNFHAVSADEGHAVFEGTPQPRHLNMGGRIHGGWALTIMDSSMGSAVMTTLPAGKASTTATLESKFMRPVEPGRLYRSTANVIKAGRTLCHVRAELIDVESNKIAGSATGTFAVIDR